jgi:tryptophan synthase alpha chain
MNEDRLQRRIREAADQGRRALIPFLPAGFPDKQRFWEEIEDLDRAGADIIEIGVPFSDPVADGPAVEEASKQALEHGSNLEWILGELGRRRTRLRSEIVLMGYVNPFMQHGWRRVAEEAADCGVAGLVVPDMPLEESRETESLLAGAGLRLIHLVGLNTCAERMRLYARRASGFVYFVSVLGTTGARGSLPPALAGQLRRARAIFPQPLALGFGIASPEQIRPLSGLLDAVVFGSALIRHVQEGKPAGRFLDPWRC